MRGFAQNAPRHRPEVLTAQTRRHHPEPLVVLVDGHGALVEVEEHTDVVAVLFRALPALPVVGSGEALSQEPWTSTKQWTSTRSQVKYQIVRGARHSPRVSGAVSRWIR